MGLRQSLRLASDNVYYVNFWIFLERMETAGRNPRTPSPPLFPTKIRLPYKRNQTAPQLNRSRKPFSKIRIRL
jgi:hypothetical protein